MFFIRCAVVLRLSAGDGREAGDRLGSLIGRHAASAYVPPLQAFVRVKKKNQQNVCNIYLAS